MYRARVLAFILAGGKGERLYPLTRDRGKPAVPFGGKYRIADFVLSNFVNSGIYALYVLVQYKAQSLIEHLRNAWRLGGVPDHFIIVVPPQMRRAEVWYQGTADAVYQNLNLVRDFHPDVVAIFGSDHVYRMDISAMIEFHRQHDADATVAALPVSIEEARSFGVIATAGGGRIVRFVEKPDQPAPIPADPRRAFASMGNYVFRADALADVVSEDAKRDTDHDFGRTILPQMVSGGSVYAYDFAASTIPGLQPYEERGYWRDVGTIGAYWQAHMDLLGSAPKLDLANPRWPILTSAYPGPSARILDGAVDDSLIGEGSLVDHATVSKSIVGRGVRIESGATVEESIVMDHTVVESGVRLRRVIVDRYNQIERGTVIGDDPGSDADRYHVDSSGIVVVPRGQTRF